jgi:hypothetical protein
MCSCSTQTLSRDTCIDVCVCTDRNMHAYRWLRMAGCMHVVTDGYMDGCIHGCMDGCIYGCMDVCSTLRSQGKFLCT